MPTYIGLHFIFVSRFKEQKGGANKSRIIIFWLSLLFSSEYFLICICSLVDLLDKMASSTPITNDDDDVGVFPDDEPSDEPSIIHSPLSTATFSQHIVSLYVLRQANPNNNWDIQANFVDGPKYVFRGVSVPTRPMVS
jgi:hypothetical protein